MCHSNLGPRTDKPFNHKSQGGHWSLMKGAAGGPNIVKMPGGVGIRSPSRTNERPATFTPVLAIGPMVNG